MTHKRAAVDDLPDNLLDLSKWLGVEQIALPNSRVPRQIVDDPRRWSAVRVQQHLLAVDAHQAHPCQGRQLALALNHLAVHADCARLGVDRVPRVHVRRSGCPRFPHIHVCVYRACNQNALY